MRLPRNSDIVSLSFKTAILGLLFVTATALSAKEPGLKAQSASDLLPSGSEGQSANQTGPPASVCEPANLGSPFVPVDSWIYPAMFRLYGLGFVDHVFLGMRPWTRSSINRMIEDVAARLEDADPGPETDQAQELYEAIAHELRFDMAGPCLNLKGNSRIESVYTVARGISGTPLRDSYHLGASIINDYGRPYANGFNNYTGVTNLTYKIRSTSSTGTGSITAKVTTDFSPAGGPSVATPPSGGDALNYTCTVSAPGTACTGTVTASTTAATSVSTFGAGAHSAVGGNTASASWTLTNDPS